MTDEIKELKKQVEELKKENTELQRELSVHNFLDTGVPQERLDYQRELKKEIIRLKSLCRRAADEIKMLDDKLQEISPDPDGTHTSVNLLSRLDGRIGGHYAHPSLEEHPPDCPWHKDWHACNCGLFDKENEE